MISRKDIQMNYRLERSILEALRYVVSCQSEYGAWLEWSLPPGESDAWATAYIGYKLRMVPHHLKNKVKDSLSRASDWILKKEYADGGWGYNDLVGSDADSTAYTIMFLDSTGRRPPEEAYDLLNKFRSNDGGFSTYVSRIFNSSWEVSHPDVTPIVLTALLTRYGPVNPTIVRGIEYVLEQQNSEGTWNSFWWNTCLYSTEANLALLDKVSATFDKDRTKNNLHKIRPKNPFEAALLISSLLLTDTNYRETNKILDLVNYLLQNQQLDGCWKSEYLLRVTDRNCYDPWTSEDAGILYSENKMLFTTLTVLEALCKLLNLTNRLTRY
jgi:squalene cyclase